MSGKNSIVYSQQLIQELTFDELYTVRTIASTGSFSETSRLLYVTQPAISRRIRHMERILGDRIFDRRSGLGVTVTPLGEQLLKFCDDALRRLDEFTAELAATRSPNRESELAIVAPSDMIEYVLAPAVAELSKQSACTLRLYQSADRDQVVRMMASGKADLAFDRLPVSSSLEAVARISEGLHLVARPDHQLLDFPLADRVEQLGRYPFIAYAPGMRSGDLIHRWLAKIGALVQPADEFRNPSVMKKFVVDLGGISVLPASVVADELASGALVTVDIEGMPLTRSTIIATRQDEHRPELTAFLDDFVDLCGHAAAPSLSCLEVFRV